MLSILVSFLHGHNAEGGTLVEGLDTNRRLLSWTVRDLEIVQISRKSLQRWESSGGY